MGLKLTVELIDKLSDEKALEILREIVELDIEMTSIFYPEKSGIENISAPYLPGVVGSIYLTDGLIGVKNLKLSPTGVKETLKLYLKMEQSLSNLLNKEDVTEGDKTEVMSIKLDEAKIIRNTIKVLKNDEE